MKLADQVFDISQKKEPLSNKDKAVLAWAAGQFDRLADEVVDIPEGFLAAIADKLDTTEDE